MHENWDWQIGDTVAVCAPFERRDPMWGAQVTNRGQIVAFEVLEAQPHWQEDIRWFSWPPDTQVAVVRFGDGSVGRFVKHGFPALRRMAQEEWERACRLHDRARERLDRPFSPWQLDGAGLAEAARRRWQACVAARRAGHLRLLAQRLVEREALGAAPMRCEVLHPLLRGPALALPAWMAWTGSLVARPDAPRTAGDVRKQPVQAPAGEESARRRRRLAAWATRVWQWRSPAARVGLTRARAAAGRLVRALAADDPLALQCLCAAGGGLGVVGAGRQVMRQSRLDASLTGMRTTLNIEDDALLAARLHAQRERVSLGEAVSQLLRRGAALPSAADPTQPPLRGRFALLPQRDEVITTQHVRELMEREGL